MDEEVDVVDIGTAVVAAVVHDVATYVCCCYFWICWYCLRWYCCYYCCCWCCSCCWCCFPFFGLITKYVNLDVNKRMKFKKRFMKCNQSKQNVLIRFLQRSCCLHCVIMWFPKNIFFISFFCLSLFFIDFQNLGREVCCPSSFGHFSINFILKVLFQRNASKITLKIPCKCNLLLTFFQF